ncbi:MAG: AMP-binding protein, partial [Arenibacterium sp.]
MTGLSLEDAVRHVTTTNPTYKVGKADIRGVTYPVFESIPKHTRDLLQAADDIQTSAAGDYLVFGDERWSYAEFCHDINRMAHALSSDLGVVKGQPVAMAMRNCPEMLILMMAITSIGGVVVFLNAWWTTEELDYALRDSGAALVFADAERVRRLTPLATELGFRIVGTRDGEPLTERSYSAVFAGSDNMNWPTQTIETDDDMAVMYSSGTTGHPKGVVQTHRGAMNAVYTWLMQTELAPLIEP